MDAFLDGDSFGRRMPFGASSLEVTANEDQTFYATGRGGFFLRRTTDDNTPPQPGTIRLRVVNFSVEAGPVDIFITAQSDTLAAANPAVTNVGVNGISAYFTVAPGAWRVRAVRADVPASARNVNVVGNVNQQIWERGARTIALADVTNSQGVSFGAATILADQ